LLLRVYVKKLMLERGRLFPSVRKAPLRASPPIEKLTGRCKVIGIRKDFDYTNAADRKIWHPLSLQALPAKDFVITVNRILSGKYGMLTYRSRELMNG